MMSNPPPSLQNRQRLHQRQQSTPVAFEAMKVQIPPNPARQNMHRRGQSFDMSKSPIRRQHQRTGSAVSTNTNLGQHILREAQQQRIARPGQQQIQPRLDTSIAQQYGGYPPTHSLPGTPYDMTMNAYMSIPQNMIQHSQFQNMQMPMQMQQNSPIPFSPMDMAPNYFQATHQFQEAQAMNLDRRMSQPDLRLQTGLRPYTPTHQIQTANFPLTPATTPMQHHSSQNVQKSPKWHQTDDNIISPKPVSMSKSRSLQGIAEHQEVQSFSEDFDLPELPPKDNTTSAKEPSKQKKSSHSTSNATSSATFEAQPLFGEMSQESTTLDKQPYPVLSSSQAPSSPTRPSLSPRRMSISDLKLEPGISASIEETNVTLDDIAQFIEGPLPDDGKWICKYEDCNKRFGRKENIKSHVQTHLGDRQFRCDHCQKCFVRGHDLKRHAKIHTGTKAYACMCGNAFARHDALTRHRQRGMCIGAFEGVVRKDVKRGRPRKHRPEMDDRLDKASRSRRNQDGSNNQMMSFDDIYASSASSCSMSSWGSPSMDNLSIHGSAQSPRGQYEETLDLFGLTQQDINQQNSMNQAALPPNMFSSFTPPTSPGYSTGNRSSPSYREFSPAEMGEQIMSQVSAQSMNELDLLPPQHQPSRHSRQMLDDSNQLSSQSSLQSSSPQFMHLSAPNNLNMFSNDLLTIQTQHGQGTSSAPSLPALSHSSSPPPQEPGSALVFDFNDDNANFRMSTMSNISNMSFGLSSIAKAMNSSSGVQSMTVSEEQQRNEFDSFLEFNDDSTLGVKFGLDDSDPFFAGM